MDRELQMAVLAAHRAEREKEGAFCRIQRIKKALEDILEGLKSPPEIRFTGSYVLLRKKGEGWEFVAIVNPVKDTEIPEEFDLSIPIPVPSSVPEFKGW